MLYVYIGMCVYLCAFMQYVYNVNRIFLKGTILRYDGLLLSGKNINVNYKQAFWKAIILLKSATFCTEN